MAAIFLDIPAPYHFAMIYFVIAHQEMDQAGVTNAFQHIFFFGTYLTN
jgi:hypothetical protein